MKVERLRNDFRVKITLRSESGFVTVKLMCKELSIADSRHDNGKTTSKI